MLITRWRRNLLQTSPGTVLKIRNLIFKNFKRFTDLSISEIPETAKLVLVIGPNGSGKSSIFDGFEWLSRPSRGKGWHNEDTYYCKDASDGFSLSILLGNGETLTRKNQHEFSNTESAKRFYGRSSLRVVPRLAQSYNYSSQAVQDDTDRPSLYIEPDTRFISDVYHYAASMNRALRVPTFAGQSADTLKIFNEYIEPLNGALARIFGEVSGSVIQFDGFDDPEPQRAPQLWFRKGVSRIAYDLLSHGEKQVVISLLNFLVRKEQLQDSIIFIDEMDAHMNTALQHRLIKEITENWIPDTSQFWTATHSIGFIDYARRAEHAVILDFSGLDLDVQQDVLPSSKSDIGLYDIAVDRHLIGELAGSRDLLFVENTDIKYYAPILNTPSQLLLPARDKRTAFYTAQALEKTCLIDRDYLTNTELDQLTTHYPFCRILKYYSMENYLYHPENVREALGSSFQVDDYIKAWLVERDALLSKLTVNLKDTRKSYPFYLEPTQEKQAKLFHQGASNLADALASPDFETFFAVFPAKDHGGAARALVGLPKDALAKTGWFREQISNIILKH